MIKKNFLKRIITSLVLISILFSMFISSMMMIITVIIISSLSFYEFNRLFFNIFENIFLKLLLSGLILLYLLSFVFIIFYIESVNTLNPNYKLFFLYSVVISITSDLGGYFFGKLLKGKKLTKISPNKTVSGVIGAFIFSILIIPIFYTNLNFISTNLLFVATILISLVSQLGDLFISFLKRLAKVKDTGNILPGHGGILDRVDGILFATPLGLFLLDYLSVN
jgi:phosphatidate cytidylyltransferase